MVNFTPEIKRHTKTIAIGGVVVAIVIVGGMLYLMNKNTTRLPSRLATTTGTGIAERKVKSEHYNKVLEEYNEDEALKARKTGTSFIAVNFPEKEKQVPVALENIIPPAPPIPAPPVMYVPQSQHRNGGEVDKELQQSAKNLVGLWTPQGHASAAVSSDGGDYVNSLHVPVSAAGNQQRLHPVKIVDDFAVVPAILETALDTDENSVVSAYIPSGDYRGARLFALDGYSRINSTIDLTFTNMTFNGVTYRVTAKPVDTETMRTALSGEVNNRYFSRIVVPAIAQGVANAGGLFAQSNANQIITDQGAVIQTYPEAPNSRAVAGTIIGGAAQQAGNVVAADAARLPPRQITIKAGTTIGVMFIGPVLATDAITDSPAQAQEHKPDLQNAAKRPQGTPDYPAPVNNVPTGTGYITPSYRAY